MEVFSMNNQSYKSCMAKYISAFIDEKIALGYKALNQKSTLKQFDVFLMQKGHSIEYISKSLYDEWLTTIPHVSSATKRIKNGTMIQFCQYMCSIGIECYIPRRLPLKSEFIPHIFTRDELDRIFKIANELQCKQYQAGTSLMIIPALLRLLFSTGIRIGEALSLKNEDIDFNRHVIILNKTKNGNQRLAPINASLESVLKQYLYYRNKIPISSLTTNGAYFFITHQGKKCTGNCVRVWFREILKKADIPYRGRKEGPRIHDFRHTAAIYALQQLTDLGKDPYCSLPILSVFMGHTSIQNTEYYLRLTQEMFPAILEQDAVITASIQNVISRSLLIKNYEDGNL